MNDLKEKIINLIAERNGRIGFKELKSKLEVDSISLENLILELKLDGKILQLGNKYQLFPDDLVIGEVSTTLSGNKVIFYNDVKYTILDDELSKAVLLNDVVAIRLNDNDEASVVSIIDRRIKNITCEVKIVDGVKKIIPYHKNIKVSLGKDDLKEVLDGDIIIVDIDINEEDEYCNARLVKKLDIKNSPNKDEIIIAMNYGFDNDYSDEYLEELSRIPKDTSNEDLSKRVDFRELTTCTIDGIYTKDMDDAVSARRIDDNIIRVYVHISDVAHYVKPGSLLFKRACEKTTSLYLNNSVFHMFHHIISNGICSLNQGEDRLTKTAIMDIDRNGNIVNYNVVKSVINSNKKMSYEDVDEILVKGKVPDGYEEYVDFIKLLNEAALRIRGRMERNGMNSYANMELEKKYDDDGKLIEYHSMGESPARKLIEFLMIAANESIANFIYYSPLPGVYRVHESPDTRKINEAIATLNALGKRIKPVKEVDDPTIIQKILMALKDDPDYQILCSIIIRFNKRARYSTDALGHFALALFLYTHFTSPIRRLMDLLVSYILDILIDTPEKITSINYNVMENELEKLCIKASQMSRNADLAERMADKNAIVNTMIKDIGEEFYGVVLGIGELTKIRINSVDVTVKKDSFGDHIRYDKKRKLFYDWTNGVHIKVGSMVIVKLLGIDEVNKELKIMVMSVEDSRVLEKPLGKVRTLKM